MPKRPARPRSRKEATSRKDIGIEEIERKGKEEGGKRKKGQGSEELRKVDSNLRLQ